MEGGELRIETKRIEMKERERRMEILRTEIG